MNNLKEAIKGIEDNIEFIEQIIDSEELARKHKFRGSPTILINGEDLESLPPPDNPSLSCRLYADGLPQPQIIKERIKLALEKDFSLYRVTYEL